MPRLRPRIAPLGVALTVWDVYRRLTPRQRKMVLDLARKHGPKVASRVLEMRRAAKKR
ncbi:MAG: hypothetical protein ABUS54_12305 [Actinomycetota bacterium]